MSLAFAYHVLKEYSDSNPHIERLLNNIDLHILHSMNPDGFEKAEQVCKSLENIGRSNANGVSKIQKLLHYIFSILFS